MFAGEMDSNLEIPAVMDISNFIYFINLRLYSPDSFDLELAYFMIERLKENFTRDIINQTTQIGQRINEINPNNLRILEEYLTTLQDHTITNIIPLSPHSQANVNEDTKALLLIVLENPQLQRSELLINKNSFLAETPSEI